MATRRPLALVSGNVQELPTGDRTAQDVRLPILVGPTSLTTAGANLACDASAGDLFTFTASSAATTTNLPVPTNGVDTQSINIELATSGIATTLTVNALILLAGGLAATITIPAGKKWFGGLRRSGGSWYLLASAVQN